MSLGLLEGLGAVLAYAALSLLRMFAGLALSYAFAIPYGVIAARSRAAERVLLPILDVLQSVPILGFFPVAIILLIGALQGSRLALELAAIFLIFTSMAWNLAFAVYEGVSALPSVLEEAAKVYRLSPLQKLRRLFIPAAMPKLVYNGTMSWAGGWFFLISAEYITLGSTSYRLPGLGSYLAQATFMGDFGGFLLGLTALLIILALMELFFWLPLHAYAERFVQEAVAPERGSGYYLSHISAFAWLRRHVRLRVHPSLPWKRGPPHMALLRRAMRPSWGRLQPQVRLVRALVLGATVAIPVLIIALAPQLLLQLKIQLSMLGAELADPRASAPLRQMPLYILYSLARLAAAYALSLAWSFPLVAWLSRKGGRGLYLLSVVAEVLASIPATAFFPLFTLAAPYLPGGYWLVSVLLTMTGMQWYILFNLLGGISSIPTELREASSVYGLRGIKLWSRLILPASLPSLVTGSITAWGGGWNTLIVSEYIVTGKGVVSLPGIGSLLSTAAFEIGNNGLLLASLGAMVLTVLALNRLVWKRIYRFTLARFKLEA